MRRTTPLAFLALALPGIASAATCPKPDPADVVKTMTDMYAAASVDDGARLATIFTPDAVEFDGGKRFTGSALWDLVKTVHAAGVRIVWTVQDADVHFVRIPTKWAGYSDLKWATAPT